MAKVYADLCEAGKRTCINADGLIQVPNKYLADTILELEKRGRIDLIPA